MPGTGHQATAIQAAQQFVNAGQRVQDAELLLDPLTKILASTDTALWIRGRTLDVVADFLLLLPRQVAMIPATMVDQTIQSLSVVTVDPRLNGAPTRTQRGGDAGGGFSLHRQDNHLNPIA